MNLKTMKALLLTITVCLLTTTTLFSQKKDHIVVTGKVKFPPDAEHQAKFPFKLTGPGVDKTVTVDAEGNYRVEVPSNPARLYDMNVFAWDRVSFWANEDDLKIDFRGQDTAKVKIKNPPFVYIESNGRDNQLINVLNWETYQNYQNVIAIGKRQYMSSVSKDTAMHRSLSDLMMMQYDNMGTRAKLYAKTFRNEPQVVYALRYLSAKRDKDFILEIVNPLLEKYPWLTQAQEAKDNIEVALAAAKKTEFGAKFLDFKQADAKGGQLSVYEVLKGKKYLLVDFWASWCGPCRGENPVIKQVYEKYKNAGFEVLGVSLDHKKDAWLKAIKEDELPWPQISDVKGWKNEVAVYYNITSIPMNFLIDKDGKIVAKNLRGADLEKKIAELLK